MSTANTLQVATPSDREILISRDFNAPRQMVFDAHTKPELMKLWLFGPDGWRLDVCEVDLRIGGKYRLVFAKGDTSMGMGGEYRDIDAPARLVTTELFDQDWTGGETLCTATFDERGGKTRLETRVLYSSKEARDGALRSGMTDGMEAGYARLEKILVAKAA